MSKERAKGTRGENGHLKLLRIPFPEAERSGSNHYTPWGPADFINTGTFAIEAKNWSDPYKAIRRGWPQATSNAKKVDLEPILLVTMPHKRASEGLFVVREEMGIRLLARYVEGVD